MHVVVWFDATLANGSRSCLKNNPESVAIRVLLAHIEDILTFFSESPFHHQNFAHFKQSRLHSSFIHTKIFL